MIERDRHAVDRQKRLRRSPCDFRAAISPRAAARQDAVGSAVPIRFPSRAPPGRRPAGIEAMSRAGRTRLPADAANILIVLLDDVGFGAGRHVRRSRSNADADAPRRRRRRLQPVPHDLDLLADARGADHRAQSPARRLGHDRRAGARLRRLHRRHPEERGTVARCCATTATTPRLRQVAQHAGDGNHRDGSVRPWPTGYGFDYFYGFMAARPTNMSRACSRTRFRSNQRS